MTPILQLSAFLNACPQGARIESDFFQQTSEELCRRITSSSCVVSMSSSDFFHAVSHLDNKGRRDERVQALYYFAMGVEDHYRGGISSDKNSSRVVLQKMNDRVVIKAEHITIIPDPKNTLSSISSVSSFLKRCKARAHVHSSFLEQTPQEYTANLDSTPHVLTLPTSDFIQEVKRLNDSSYVKKDPRLETLYFFAMGVEDHLKGDPPSNLQSRNIVLKTTKMGCPVTAHYVEVLYDPERCHRGRSPGIR